jgi:(4S)-4-hydroxy-5-phosphonooxypentane-2,3-dione isomerase
VSVVLAVSWVARAGEEQRVAEHLHALAEAARSEPGCELYEPCRDPDDPARFFIFERFADDAAFEAHTEAEHTRIHGHEGAIPLLESRVRTVWRPLEAGG